MRSIFIVLLVSILSLSNVVAQSKKEQKAMAKHQELVAASTAEDGSRIFTSTTDRYRCEIRSCELLEDGGAIIQMLFWNDTAKDVNAQFVGDYYAFRTCSATDSFGRMYKGEVCFSYTIGNSDKKYKTTELNLVPSGGPIRVKLSISHINLKSTYLKEVQFIALVDGLMVFMQVGDLKFIN